MIVGGENVEHGGTRASEAGVGRRFVYRCLAKKSSEEWNKIRSYDNKHAWMRGESIQSSKLIGNNKGGKD